MTKRSFLPGGKARLPNNSVLRSLGLEMVRIVLVMIVMMTSLMVSMVMIVLRSLGLKMVRIVLMSMMMIVMVMVRVVLVNYDDDDVNGDDCDGPLPDEVRGVRVQRATERLCVPPEKK